ncbi:MAG TPA: nucleotidyltransferase family protein [Burkholderiaceae bacterium]|jgi:hypothetical protein
MPEQSRLPPTREIGAALRKTTERLARELATPTEEAPTWTDFEWRAAMAAAVMHGVSALLANRLRWRGPAFWEAFLAEQKTQGLLRQQRVEALLARTHTAAEQAGLGLLALKGSALLGLKLYEAGERPMSDIDLLVREEDFEAAAGLLESLDYERDLMSWKHLNLVPRGMPDMPHLGEHVENPIKFDLHTRVLERLPVHEVVITAQTFPPQLRAGLNAYPSKVALMRHLLLHTAGNLCVKSVRLIQLQDIARLARVMSSTEWESLIASTPEMGWALPPLDLANRYFEGSIPDFVIAGLQAACPLWLRRSLQRQSLADVSLSKMNIPAFPGLEWSRSPAEALELALKRVFPNRETRAVAQSFSTLPPARLISDWNGRSQLWKILSWVFVRPPRVSTLYSVRLALDYQAQ